MKFSDYIVGFLVFGLFLSVIFSSMNYMYSSNHEGSYGLTLNDSDSVMVADFLELGENTFNVYKNQSFDIQRTSPGGNETADNPEDAASLEQDISTWKVLWSIPSTFGQVGKVVGLTSKHFGGYVPDKVFTIILVTILIAVVFLVISAVRKHQVE